MCAGYVWACLDTGHCVVLTTLRVPDGTSVLLSDLLIKLLKKIPRERLGHGEINLFVWLIGCLNCLFLCTCMCV